MVIIDYDIYELWKMGKVVCITTNCYVKKNGCAVMGRGNANRMLRSISGLDIYLGKFITLFGCAVGFIYENIIAFPVKPAYDNIENALDRIKALYSGNRYVPGYHAKARLDIIAKSIDQLNFLIDAVGLREVYLPIPGIGNGELSYEDVAGELSRLNFDVVRLVRYGG